MQQSLLSLESVTKNYKSGSETICVLKNIHLEIKSGESVCILGPSGCGKTTLLQICSGIDKPSFGKILLDGENLSSASKSRLSGITSKDVSFVYQNHNLLPEFNAIENIEISMFAQNNLKKSEIRQIATDALVSVGLKDRVFANPSEMSGGEKQRVSIARALCKKPKIVFADEPTGNLDPKRAEDVTNLLLNFCKEQRSSIVFVTHNTSLAKKFDTTLKIENGSVVKIKQK